MLTTETSEKTDVLADFSCAEDAAVFVINNDSTPFDFVVEFVSSFFGTSQEEARRIATVANESGECLCKKYPREVVPEIMKAISRKLMHSDYFLEFKVKEAK